MSDNVTNDSSINPESNPELEEEVLPSSENDASQAASNEEVAPLDQALEEVAKWKDLALRNLAELENYRKRVARERQDDLNYANQRLLERLLPVVDNFSMGLEAARQENESSMIFIGMNMVFKQIEEFLSDQKVEEIPAENQVFDAKWHEAVSQEPSNTVPEGTIIRVLRKGYKIQDRVLRAPNVVVSSGPATAEGETPAATEND